MLRHRVVEEIGGRLTKLGFRRKGNTWRRETDHGIEVFNIQGSSWNETTFYLNAGVYVGDDRLLVEPVEAQCLLRQRIPHDARSADQVLEALTAWFEAQARQIAEWPRPAPAGPVRVKHATFGPGTVIADKGSSVEVAFDDGTTKLLARSFLQFV